LARKLLPNYLDSEQFKKSNQTDCMNKMKTTSLFLSVTAALAIVTTARADMIDMTAIWSDSFTGSSAVATFILDTSALPNPGSGNFAPTSVFQNFQLTVSGALDYSGVPSGNGIFHLSDFNSVYWGTYGSATLDFTKELVGQPTQSWGDPWGISGLNGEFTLGAATPFAPNATGPFTLRPAGSNELLILTSFAPTHSPAAVPETSTWVMGFLALGAAVFLIRRKPMTN
jgi:hypothetical protein